MKHLSGLAYYGGKNMNGHGVGLWIHGLLPTDRDVLYCEPCVGQGGQILGRAPSKHELVNDINERLDVDKLSDLVVVLHLG